MSTTAEEDHQARVDEYLKQLQQFLMDAVDPATFETINSSLEEELKTRGGWEGFLKYYQEHPELVDQYTHTHTHTHAVT